MTSTSSAQAEGQSCGQTEGRRTIPAGAFIAGPDAGSAFSRASRSLQSAHKSGGSTLIGKGSEVNLAPRRRRRASTQAQLSDERNRREARANRRRNNVRCAERTRRCDPPRSRGPPATLARHRPEFVVRATRWRHASARRRCPRPRSPKQFRQGSALQQEKREWTYAYASPLTTLWLFFEDGGLFDLRTEAAFATIRIGRRRSEIVRTLLCRHDGDMWRRSQHRICAVSGRPASPDRP